jgi:chemotaxis signal transduction protein
MTVESNKFLQFRLANEYYLINLENIVEVVRDCRMQKIPHTLPEVLGVMYFRGEIVTIIDLANAFDVLAEKARDIIVFNYEKFKIGFMIESAIGVIDVDNELIEVNDNNPAELSRQVTIDNMHFKILDLSEFMTRYAA